MAVRRLKISWKNLILGALVALGCLGYLYLADRQFAWWYDRAFAGEVVDKLARHRDTGDPADDTVALKAPKHHRFFLRLTDEDGLRTHEVTVSLYRQARVGDWVGKVGGTYTWRHEPGAK